MHYIIYENSQSGDNANSIIILKKSLMFNICTIFYPFELKLKNIVLYESENHKNTFKNKIEKIKKGKETVML